MWCRVQTTAYVSTYLESIMYVKVIQCFREFSVYLHVWEHTCIIFNKSTLVNEFHWDEEFVQVGMGMV